MAVPVGKTIQLSLYLLFLVVTALVYVALKVIDLVRWLASRGLAASAQRERDRGRHAQALRRYRLARKLALGLRETRGAAALGEARANLALWRPADAEKALSLAQVSHYKAAQASDPEFAAAVLGTRALAAALRGDAAAFQGFEQRAALPGPERPALALARAVQACREHRWVDAGRSLAALPEGAVAPPGLIAALRAWSGEHTREPFEAPDPAALWAGAPRDEVRRVWPELVDTVEERQRFGPGRPAPALRSNG